MTVLFSLTKPVGKLTIGLLIKNASFAFDKRGIDRLFRFTLLDGGEHLYHICFFIEKTCLYLIFRKDI